MPTILVADDEPDLEALILQRFRRRIRSGDFSFRFVRDGQQAIEVLKDDPSIDVLLTDINMPRVDGLTLLNELADIRPDIRSVVVSAYGDMDNIRTAMNSGAFDFVTKPIDFQDLEITLDKTLEHVALLRDAASQERELSALRRELEVARGLQQSILPRRFPSNDRFDVYAEMHPARSVGGDFYDIFALGDGRYGLVVGDVVGKGVPAALFMAIARTTLKATALSGCTAGQCLARVNDQITSNETAEILVTMFYAIYDPETGDLAYANAGHDLPVVLRGGGVFEDLANPDGVLAGVEAGLDYQTRTIRLEAGESVVVYTDGVVDSRQPDGERFGLERFMNLLREAGGSGSAQDILGRIFAGLTRHVDEADPADDITCMVLHRNR